MALSVNLSAYAAAGGAPLAYSAGASYVVGDVVLHSGTKYKCKSNSTGNTPATGANTFWVEIVEKTIGGATRDYQTIAAWIAACPALTTTNQIWKGLIYKEGSGATEWSTSIALYNTNTFTGADNFFWLEPAPGQGFIDNANVRTNALVYNNANGVSVSNGAGEVYGGDRCGHSLVRGLQLRGYFGIGNTSTFLNVSQCIIDWGSTSASFAAEFGTLKAVNSAFRSAQTSGNFVWARGPGHDYTNCTFLGAGGTSVVFDSPNSSNITIKNCAIIGFSSIAVTGAIINSAASTYNATDLASFGYTGTGNLTSLAAASQLENTSSPFDMRAKAGAALINGAIRVQSETGDFDISRFSRSTTTPTIGAWEFASVTYTYARPTSDITTQWTPSTGTDHYALIDEVTASDADYIFATAGGQTDEVKLAAMTAPKAGTSVDVQYRVQGVAGGGKVTLSLVCNTTVIATDAIRSADGDYVLTVAPATWAAVTDWSNMRLRFVSSI